MERIGEARLLLRVEEQPLRLRVRLDERDLLVRAAREPQVLERHVVDREDAARGAVLGRHVGDGRAVGDRDVPDAVAEELDELADDPLLPEHLRHGQHEIGRRRALGELAGQLEADDLREEHRHRLPEHRGLGLDAAAPPAEHAEAIDHRRVRVRPDERVWVGFLRLVVHEDDAREVLEVDLVDDARVRRHDAEVVERLLSPAQKLVALLVALELEQPVQPQGVVGAVLVDLHRVVDDELDGLKRVDLLGVSAEPRHRVAHRGEVDHGGHAREVLEQHPARHERDLARRVRLRVPLGDGLDVALRVTSAPSSRRRRFSRRIFIENGSFATCGNFFSSAGRLWMVCPPSVVLVPKVLELMWIAHVPPGAIQRRPKAGAISSRRTIFLQKT